MPPMPNPVKTRKATNSFKSRANAVAAIPRLIVAKHNRMTAQPSRIQAPIAGDGRPGERHCQHVESVDHADQHAQRHGKHLKPAPRAGLQMLLHVQT